MRACAIFLVLSTVGAATVTAQSLADVARKERERRQTAEPSGKSYTNQDLKPVPGAPPGADSSPAENASPGAADAAGADTAAKSGDASADKSADDKSAADKNAADKGGGDTGDGQETGAKDQEYWAKRMAQLREQLDRDETYLRAMQNRIDSLTTDFVNRDDPAQKSLLAADRIKALEELDRLKKAVEQDRKAIPELEEEARREGVPAGWLR